MTTDKLAEALRSFTAWFTANYPGPDTIISDPNWHAPRIFRAARYALVAHAAEAAQHTDDAAVDAFAGAMKAKLAAAREKGRGGWQDKDDCPQQRLSDMLRAHVEKGDPCDVANFCMFLHQRDEPILPAETAQPAAQAEVCQNCGEQLPVGCCGVFIDEKSCMYTSAQKEHPNG